MKGIFITTFVIYSIIEIYIIVQFIKNKKLLELKSTISSFGVICLLLLAIYLFHLNIPYYILLLCVITLFFHTFVGYYLNYYNKSMKFDRYLHTLGTFSFALLCYITMSNFIEYGGSKIFRAIFILFFGITLGAVFEVYEFVIDSKQKSKMQKSLKDTNFDIAFNILGSIIATIYAYCVFL